MARCRQERIEDTLELLRTEVDVWVATASAAGKPYLVPLSFYWNGEAMIAYVRATEFDPRPWNAGYTFFRLIPERIQAWRGDDAEELRDRDPMREGVFL